MFQFQEDYILENQVAQLSPLELSHQNTLFGVSNDQEIWKYFLENGYGSDNFSKYIQKALQNRANRVEYPFVIFDKRVQKIAGMTRLYAVDVELGNIKIGHTWIGSNFQGTDLNKNCKFLLFEFIFDTLKMNRTGFGASSENIKSINALKSVGCQEEGKLRSYLPSIEENGRADIILMSLLADEWKKSVKETLKTKIKKG